MSEGSHSPRDLLTIKTWSHCEPAARATQRPRELVQPDLARDIDEIRREISERTRRALDYPSDSASDSDTPVHITTQREFVFDVDNSLIRVPETTPVENLSDRDDLCSASDNDSVFNPTIKSASKDMDETAKGNAVDATTVDKEIELLRIEASRHTTENIVEPRPGTSRESTVRERGYSLAWDDYQLPRTIPVKESPSGKTAIDALVKEVQNLRATVEKLTTDSRNPRETREPNFALGVSNLVTPPIRNQDPFLRLKEARSMIPTFDGSSEEKLKGFLKACSFAFNLIHPADESLLTQAIICTKLTDRALIEVENREILTFPELKETLESCFPMRKTATQLQREFNYLRQNPGEDAHAYGNRVERLVAEWFEAATDGKGYSPSEKRTIHEFIKDQALVNYQLGLNERLQTIVRSRAPASLAEAISEAVGEEKVRGTDRTYSRPPDSRRYAGNPTTWKTQVVNCQKCGKTGHTGRECRTSRYATRFPLPKAEGHPRVNNVTKYCQHCRKSGHNQEECWTLHGKEIQPTRRPFEHQGHRRAFPSASALNNDNITQRHKLSKPTENGNIKPKGAMSRPLREYESSHVKMPEQSSSGLDVILLPIEESKRETIPLLHDTGSSISFVKKRALKGDTIVTKEEAILTGVTGHHLKTIGYFYATIKFRHGQLSHKMYVIHNDCPIEYEGILGIDFLRKHQVTCDYSKRVIQIKGESLPLLPFKSYKLPPRSEVLINATTNKNTTGIVSAQKIKQGVYIGNCLVVAKNNTCIVSAINATDEEVNIASPYIELEEDATRNAETNDVHTISNMKCEPKAHAPIN